MAVLKIDATHYSQENETLNFNYLITYITRLEQKKAKCINTLKSK